MFELLGSFGNAGSLATENVGGADNHRQAEVGHDLASFFHVVGYARPWNLEPNFDHRLFEQVPVLGGVDRFSVSADQFDVVLV